jgi:ABC-type branched-subunit amino acid transport system permease subunit
MKESVRLQVLMYATGSNSTSIRFQEMNKVFQAEFENHVFLMYVILVVTLLILLLFYCILFL